MTKSKPKRLQRLSMWPLSLKAALGAAMEVEPLNSKEPPDKWRAAPKPKKRKDDD